MPKPMFGRRALDIADCLLEFGEVRSEWLMEVWQQMAAVEVDGSPGAHRGTGGHFRRTIANPDELPAACRANRIVFRRTDTKVSSLPDQGSWSILRHSESSLQLIEVFLRGDSG